MSVICAVLTAMNQKKFISYVRTPIVAVRLGVVQ